MRKKGAKGAPKKSDFKRASKTARKRHRVAQSSWVKMVETTKGPDPRDMMQAIFDQYDKSMGRRK